MFTITTSDTSTGKILGTRQLDTRAECIEWVRANVEEGRYHQVDEDPKPCRECGDPCDYSFYSLCKECRFSLNDAVKAARKVIRSAKRNGNPVVAVNDGEDRITGNERTLLEAVHSVDSSHLIFESGAWAWIVGGNDSEAECVADYNTSLETIIEDANLRED